ncbi:MAG: autotransporter-associated beta strand repeat-containing protein [Pseudomonadota bacterium]
MSGNNNYSGTTTVGGGVLVVGTGGTTGSIGTGNLVNGATVRFNRSNDYTVANAISGAGNLVKEGSGTLTLTGANSFSGGVFISAGNLVLASATGGVINAAGTGGIIMSGNTTLQAGVSGSLGNAISFGNGSATVAAATGTTLRLASSSLSFEAGAGSPLNFGTTSATGTIELAPVTVSVGAQVNPININGGTLRLASTGAYTLLNGANGVFLNGATLGADVAGTLTKVLTIGTTGGTIDVAAASTILQGGVSLSGNLTKTGAGELRLTGTGTGGGMVQVNAGTLAVQGGSALPDTAAITVASGATFQLLSAKTLGSLAGAGQVALGGNELTLAQSTNTVFTGVISGSGGLTKSGSGSLTLRGANTFTGLTTVLGTFGQIFVDTTGSLAGAVAVRNQGSFINSGTVGGLVTVDSGGSFRSNATGTLAGGLVNSGLSFVSGQVLGSVTNAGSITVDTPLTLNVTGALVQNGGFLSLNGGSATIGSLAGTGTVSMIGAATLTTGSDNTSTAYSGRITGLGPLIKVGTGTLALSGDNTFSGGVRLNGGNLQIDNPLSLGLALPGGSGVQTALGTSLRFAAPGTYAIDSVISGGGAVSKTGTGTLTLTGNNSYSGGTSILGGTLLIGGSSALGSGGVSMTGQSTLATATGVSASINGLTLDASANVSLAAASGQTLTLGGALTTSTSGNSIQFGSASQTGTVGFDFASVQPVAASTSVAVNGGTLRLNALGGGFLLSAGGGLTLASGGTIDLNGFAGGGVNLTGAGAITNAALAGAQFEASQNAASTFSGVIGGGTGAISLVKSGTGALTLTGANSYTGTTSITGGSLQIGDGGTTGNLGTGNVSIAGGAQLLFNRGDALSLANVFGGAGTVQKNLANTLTLTGSNTNENGFTGTFNVNAGTLVVNGVLGDLTNRAATVNIASGAALGGSGTIQGNVAVANGGILSPGNSPATQTITGNLSLNDSSVLNFELAQAGIVGSGINDLITVGGNLVLDGTLNVTALDGFTAGFYRLINYGGTLTNNQLVIGTQPMGFSSELRTDIAGQVNILFNAGGQTVQYWDGADLTGATATVNGEGGAGNWTSTATNWTNPTGFAVNSAWAGQAGVFAGTAGGAIGITGSQAFQELRFLTDGYVLNAADLTGGLATTGGFSIVNVNSGIATRINAPISGTAGLTKTGGGTLTLGGANSYAGLTTVSGGTLSLVSGGTIAGAVQNNATLTNAGTIIGLVTNAGTLTSTGTLAGGLTNNAGATANVAGSFGGSAITNSGTLTLTGATTGIGAFTQNLGGVFNLTNVSTSIGSLAGTGQVLMSAGGLTLGSANTNTDYAGTITGSGVLVKTGTGTQTLSGTSTFLGSTLIAQGSLVLATGTSFASALQNNATFINAGTTTGLVTNSGTLTSTGTLAGGLVNNAGATASLANAVNGAITNSGTITLTGVLSGNPSFTQNAGGSLNLAGFSTTLGSIAGTGAIQLGSGTLTAGGNNASTSFDGIISGSGTFTKTGTGTLTLGGANSFTGLTTVSQGSTLAIGATGSLAAAVTNLGVLTNAGIVGGLVNNAGTFQSTGSLNGGLANVTQASVRGNLSGPVTNAGLITLTGATSGNAAFSQIAIGTLNLAGFNATIGSLAGSGAVQLGSGTLTLGGANSSTDFAGVISGTGALVKTGTGTQTLSGANTVNGLTTINQGSIFLATGASLAGTVQNNATFINSGSVAGQVTNAGTLVSAGTLAGGLVNNAGATANLANAVNGAITNSGAITLTAGLSGSPSFTQATGGSLNLAGFNATLGSIAGTGAIQLGSGTLTAGASNASTSFDGIISGSGTFNKAGTGTLTLGGSNTAAANFTGAVNVNAGSLVLNGQFGDVAANSANLSLANGATLAGSGSFLGNISLGAGAKLAPGNSPATIAIGGNLLLDSASILNFELAQAGVVGGGINDLITVSGNLTLDGTLNVAALTGFGEGIYRLINYGGTLTDNGLLVGTRPDGFTASVITNIGGQISVQFTLGIPTVLYWDGTDTTAASSAITGNGGSGTWNSTSTNWTSAPGFSTAFGWNSQTGVFAGAAGGTVQVSGTQAFQQLRFETGGYVLDTAPGGGALATTGGTSVIDVSAGLGATINAPIQGTAGITKVGAGTLTLGGFNSYAGLTSIAAGTLALSSGGTIVGAVDNGASFANAGNVRGQVTNRASLTSTGRLDGGLVNAATGIANLSGVWNGAISNAGTVRLSGLTSGNVAFNQQGSGLFDLAGSFASIGSLAGSGSVQLGSGLLQLGRSNASTSFAGVISGSGGLEKEGTGTFTLTGANSFTGRTLVSGGTLVLASGASLAGSVTNNAVFTNAGTVANGVINNGTLVSTGSLNGSLVNNAGATASLSGAFSGNLINRGTVNLTGTTIGIGELSLATGAFFNLGGFATTIGNLTGGGGTVALGSGTLTLGSGTGSQTFDGMITGSGGLTKVSASTFSLSGAQGYTGLTTVNGGTLILGSNASLAGGVLNNARFTNAGRVSGLVTNIATLESTGALNAGLVNATGASARIRGILAGSVTNAGTITLTGAISGIGAVTQEATGTFDLGGFGTSIGSLAGSGAVILGAAPLTTGGDNGSSTFAGTVSGDGGIVKTGTGTFVLSGANSYAGLTTVSQGVLSVRNNAGLGGNAAGTVVDAGAALELQGGITLTGEALTINGTGVNGAGALRNVADNNIWAGTVTLGSDSLITADAGRLDIDLLAGSTQALTTGGAGLIGLANANTAGALTVTGGSLALFGSGNFAGGVNVNAGNLFLQGGSSVNDAAAVTLGTGNLIVAVSETIGSLAGTGGTVQIDAGQTLTLGGSDASTSFGGVIFNTGNLAKQGSGTFTVTGTLAHSGTTTITGGTLLSGAANIWQGNGLVTIGNGGTLDLGGFDQSIAAISLAGGTLANGALTGSISTSGGTIRDITGAANSLRATGGTTTLTGAGSFAQGVTLAGGDVVLQGVGASIADAALVTVNTGTLFVHVCETIGALAGSGGRVQIAQGQALVTGGSNASTAYAGVLAGNGALIKTGTGTFTLSGANTLTGTVTVNAGLLALASGGSLAGAVQNAAGFNSAGTVAGLVTNTGTLISTGALNGGLVNSGSAGLSGQLGGAVTNSGLVQLQGTLTGITGFSQTGTGTFDLAGFSTSIGSLSGAGNVLLGSATLTLGGSNASTSFAGTIGGTGGLIKSGTGGFTLTSGQAYTGLTTINAGLLTVAAGAGLSGSVLNNASFASSGLILGSLTNNGTATLSGQVNGTVANNAVIALDGQLVVLGRLTQNAGGSLNLAGFNAGLGSLAGTGPIALGSGTLVVGSDNSSSLFSGVISGSGGLQKIGTGTFTLTGINSYTGLTLVNAGTLVIGEGVSVGGTTSGIAATVAAPSVLAAPVANAVSGPIAAEQASMPAAVTSLAAEQTSMPATVTSLAAETASTVSASLASCAGMMVDNGAISGGPTPASLASSAERLPLAGGVSSGPERVDLFGDSTSGAVSANLPVVTLGEASQTVAPAAASTASAAGRIGLVSDLSNGMGTARLDGALMGGAEMASPVAAALVDANAPAASAGETAFAGPLTPAVISSSVLNNANLINNGSILGQLVNSAGATAVNNGVIRGLVTNAGTLTSTGTLSGGLSNSGTARISGTLTGDVLNSGSITLTGITSGIAVFQQAATGSLNLAGFDTTLGVLSGAGTITLGSARLTTGTNGVNSLFSGVISGTGALTKTGTGGLILDGENSYSGGTTIAGGVLQLGNGGATGSIIGPVLNNGTLIINHSNAYTFAGVISGTGMFVQAGSGTTTLTGANSYTGGTLISAGRLIGSTVSLQGLIQNDAALEFAQGTTGVFAGRIGGTGLLDKSGVGLLELTGDNSALRGATTVRAGELRVTGSLTGSATTVLSGATLSGNGTVGGLIARSGSVVSPGAGGLGMLGVNGAIQLQSGSTLRLQVQAPSGPDMLIGNGTLTLGGTAAITNLGGTYAFNSNYLLLQASGGRTGTFDAVTGFGEFGILYRPELVYTANQVLLRMAPNLLTNILGNTPLTANQRSVVSRIDAAVTAGYNPQPLFNVYALPNAQQPNAFDQLSGEVYVTMAGVGIEQERLVREAVLGRINAVAATARQTPEWGNGAGAWGQVFGSWGDGERDGNAARYESDRQGFITGIDYGNANSEGSWRIGAFGVHMTSKVSVDARGSRAEVEQTGGGLYAGVNTGGVSVGMGASVTGVDLTAVRNIALPGLAETNRGRGDGRAVQGFAELSYAIEAGNATYRPFASVAVGEFKLDALTETGGAAALSVRRQSYRSGSVTVGADGTVRMGRVNLSGTLAGRFQVGDRDPAAQIALAAAPAQAFTIRGVQLDSFALAARLDATVKLTDGADLSLGYTGLIGKDTADHGARATLSVRF